MRIAFLVMVLLVATSGTGAAQTFQNLGFADTCSASKTRLCHWDLSWGGKNAIRPADGALLIDIENNVGFAEQSAVVPAPAELKLITFTGKIKTANVTGKGAGLNLSIYDAGGALLFTRDMGGLAANWGTGTRDWQTYTVKAVCPVEAATIKIGAIVYGSGRAWFDDFNIDVVPVRDRKYSKLAEDYILTAMDTIAAHSLRRDSVDLLALRKTALQIAGAAKTPADCHLAVAYVLQALGDHHSFLMEPEVVKSWQADNPEVDAKAKWPAYRVIDGYGYIMVPGFHGGQPRRMLAFADTIQSALRQLSAVGVKGWIVDLRENDGGNMEPMIAGLGPLFSAEKLGFLVDVNGRKESWGYRGGAYYWENEKITAVSNPIVLKHQLPVAVLIGPRVGSSGEIVTISFVGNAKTRLFGQPTWGLTTGNGAFDLPDGARMMLASTVMADRSGKLYRGAVEPDEHVERSAQEKNDVELQAARRWLGQQH
jgi:carboxyl-terminal processing protease